MHLEEKMEKELKDHRPADWEKGTWSCGFKIGFKRGYTLAYEEATEELKKANEKWFEIQQGGKGK